jgi:hypothetical protein
VSSRVIAGSAPHGVGLVTVVEDVTGVEDAVVAEEGTAVEGVVAAEALEHVGAVSA